MLSLLMNRWNTIGEEIPVQIKKALPEGIGISDDLPSWLQHEIANTVPIELYESNEALGSCSMQQSIDAAASLSAKRMMISVGHFCDMGKNEREAVETVSQLSEKCSAKGIRLLITNRRQFCKNTPVSAAKLLRLSEICDVGIAFDVGASHASLRALEDFYDYYPRIEAMLLNDNYGRDALFPVGHPDYDLYIIPDDMRQPGYGTVPYVRIMEEVMTRKLDVPMFINGRRYMNASIETVLQETRVLFSGRVFINPAGGKIGMNTAGRMLIQ